METLRTDPKKFLNKHLFMMEIYITRFLQILSFSSPFRRLKLNIFFVGHHGRPPNFIVGSSPPSPPHQNVFHSTGLIREFRDLLVYILLLSLVQLLPIITSSYRKLTSIDPFHANDLFLTPENIRKPLKIFSGWIERDQ